MYDNKSTKDGRNMQKYKKNRSRWDKEKRDLNGDLPGGPVLKNPSYNAGDAGSIPGGGTKIPHAVGQLNPRATTREKPMHRNGESHILQLRPEAANK